MKKIPEILSHYEWHKTIYSQKTTESCIEYLISIIQERKGIKDRKTIAYYLLKHITNREEIIYLEKIKHNIEENNLYKINDINNIFGLYNKEINGYFVRVKFNDNKEYSTIIKYNNEFGFNSDLINIKFLLEDFINMLYLIKKGDSLTFDKESINKYVLNKNIQNF